LIIKSSSGPSATDLSLTDVVKDDETDNRYIECAVFGKASHIITGDNHLLTIGEYQDIVILPPAAFVALLEC